MNIKDAAISRAQGVKRKLAVGLAATGAVVGTVATMGVGGAILGGVAGGLIGGYAGKKKLQVEKKNLNAVEFDGNQPEENDESENENE